MTVHDEIPPPPIGHNLPAKVVLELTAEEAKGLTELCSENLHLSIVMLGMVRSRPAAQQIVNNIELFKALLKKLSIRTCATCKCVLDSSDPASRDCGGDCLRCMAEAGDPECIASMKTLKEG